MFTVLLVEVDPLFRNGLRELLEIVGYCVVACANGREAVEKLFQVRVDIVVTDLAMPEMDGFELLKILNFERPELKVIAMSGLVDQRVRDLAKSYEVAAVIEKPFSLQEILKVVRLSSGVNSPQCEPFGVATPSHS